MKQTKTNFVALFVLVVALLVMQMEVAVQAAPLAQESKDVTFTLDGVTVNLTIPNLFEEDFITSLPDDASQIATSVSWEPFREFTVTSVPFGTKPGTENVPLAQAGGVVDYRTTLHDYRVEQGANPQPAPAITLFGQEVVGEASLVNLHIDSEELKPVLIAEWVVEAGERLWIVRISQEQNRNARQKINNILAVLDDVNVESDSLDKPSTLKNNQKSPRGRTSRANINEVPWWSATCVSATSPYGSYQLSSEGEYRGVVACGPGNTTYNVWFYPDSTRPYGHALQWQCVELSMRYMYLTYGTIPYIGDGSVVVWNYKESRLKKISNDGTKHSVPVPGDVLSYGSTSTIGHTSVVKNSNVDQNGNGTITVIEQNWSPNGIAILNVSDWYVLANPSVSGWLH